MLELCICSCLAIYGVTAKKDGIETGRAKIEFAFASLTIFSILAMLTYLLAIQCSLRLAILSTGSTKSVEARKEEFIVQSQAVNIVNNTD